MIRSVFRSLLLSALIAGFVIPSFAWNDTGHKITAYIAWQYMTPAARDRVIKILTDAPEDSQIATFFQGFGSRTEDSRRRDFFMIIATWPDIVRDKEFPNRYKKYHHSNWHYHDTFWAVKDGKIVYPAMADEGGFAIEKIKEFSQTIASNAPDSQKAVAVAWLEHLIGDIHQPLHASGRITDVEPKGDQGGNLFLLTPQGTPRDKQENLHWFWDSIVDRNYPNTKDECEDDYLTPLAKKIMKDFPQSRFSSLLEPGMVDGWAKESLTAAQTTVYSDGLKRFERPSEKYKKRGFRLAEERLALAGYRMADLFNRVFGAAESVPAKQP